MPRQFISYSKTIYYRRVYSRIVIEAFARQFLSLICSKQIVFLTFVFKQTACFIRIQKLL